MDKPPPQSVALALLGDLSLHTLTLAEARGHCARWRGAIAAGTGLGAYTAAELAAVLEACTVALDTVYGPEKPPCPSV